MIKSKCVSSVTAESFFQKLAIGALVFGSIHLPAQSDPKRCEQLDCVIALTLASKAFDRANLEIQKNNAHRAHELRMGFWDVDSFSKHCPEVKKLALRMTDLGLAADSKPPTESTYADWPKRSVTNIPNCPFGMKCILVKGGGAGIGQGHGMPHVFVVPKGGGAGIGEGHGKPHVFVVPDDIKLPANPVLK